MSHENSITEQRDGKWFNLSGHTGYPLKPQFDFEQSSYPDLPSALAAASRRSSLGGAPQIGMPSYNKSQDFVGSLVANELIQDPASQGYVKQRGVGQDKQSRLPISARGGLLPTFIQPGGDGNGFEQILANLLGLASYVKPMLPGTNYGEKAEFAHWDNPKIPQFLADFIEQLMGLRTNDQGLVDTITEAATKKK